MKYKVGDKVRIRADLEIGCDYGNNVFIEDMESFKGKVATITRINARNEYTIDVDAGYWSWTDEMLEPIVDCDFKVGDKVIFNPNEKNKLLGVFTVSDIDMDLGIPYIKLEGHDMWFKPDIFLKVPLFKKGDIVTFKDIEKDKWFSPGPMSEIEGCRGVIEEVKENYYKADKQSQDGCEYKVKDIKTGNIWFVTSASIELASAINVKNIEYYSKEEIQAATTTAEAMAQAVDNVKSPQFKVGDTVVIRNDLVPGQIYNEWAYDNCYNGWFVDPNMKEFFGKVAKITDYVEDNPHYCRLNVDGGRWSWIVNALLPYTPGSDYDLDRTIITYKQTKQNYENRLQESDPVISGGKERSGCAVCYPGSKTSIGIGHLRDSATACKR